MSVPRYDVVAPLALFQTLKSLRPKERRAIDDFLTRVARSPGTKGDFEAPAEDGRMHEAKVVGRWLVSFWVDDAVCEVRFTGLERIE